MAFDFPNSPTEGQVFTPAGGPTYIFKSPVWQLQGSNAGLISDTPPPSPAHGQLWWESDSGNLFVYYNDGTSSQWVQVNVTSGLGTAQARNYIVNPSMQVSAENGNTGGTTNVYYGADQWYLGNSGLGTTAIGRSSASTVPSGFILSLASQSVNASLAAGALLYMQQPIEGVRVSDLMWGTTSAKPVVVRFMLTSNYTGTLALALRNTGGAMSYVAPITVTATGVWTEYVVSIPGPTTGTWARDNSLGILFGFCMAAGSTYTTATPNTWVSANVLGFSGMTNGAAANGNQISIYDVGLYMDPNNTGKAPPFELPDLAREQAACQRYWCSVTCAGRSTANVATVYLENFIYWPVTMRASPTAGGPFGASNVNVASVTLPNATASGVRLLVQSAAVGDFYTISGVATANARM